MISWSKRPLARMTTRAMRMRFYLIAFTVVAASVPFLHLYMDVQLSPKELAAHVLSVVASTAVAVLLMELSVWVYLKRREGGGWSISIGLFWLLLFSIFLLSFVVMMATHDFFPVTLDIWNRHIVRDLGIVPWKIVPVVLLIGYILIQLIHRYNITQELTVVRAFNKRLHGAKGSEGLPGGETKEMPEFVFSYKGEEHCLDPLSIIRVESSENYCHIFTASDEDKNSCRYMIRITLSEVVSRLPENLFLRVHRSHLVNFHYVSSCMRQGRNYQMQLSNGDCVPVSRSRIRQVKSRVLGQ